MSGVVKYRMDNNWNALGQTVYEAFFKNETKARLQAQLLARQYGCDEIA